MLMIPPYCPSSPPTTNSFKYSLKMIYQLKNQNERNRPHNYPFVSINNIIILYSTEVKYQGFTLHNSA